ncbi:hypothetical protein FGB62_129g011 [Gracilaria domingensis]|nr:hypothetical protein FGB62_129g011 [Gracilaria domingensis]
MAARARARWRTSARRGRARAARRARFPRSPRARAARSAHHAAAAAAAAAWARAARGARRGRETHVFRSPPSAGNGPFRGPRCGRFPRAPHTHLTLSRQRPRTPAAARPPPPAAARRRPPPPPAAARARLCVADCRPARAQQPLRLMSAPHSAFCDSVTFMLLDTYLYHRCSIHMPAHSRTRPHITRALINSLFPDMHAIAQTAALNRPTFRHRNSHSCCASYEARPPT